MIKVYCVHCKNYTPIIIEPLVIDIINSDAWGDIICGKCGLVIATLSVDKEEAGIYQIVKNKELSSKL